MKTCIDCCSYPVCVRIPAADHPACNSFRPVERISNQADKIRHMGDEELADFLGDWARRHLAWMQDNRGEVLWWLQHTV